MKRSWCLATPAIATSGVLIAEGESSVIGFSPWHGFPSSPHVLFHIFNRLFNRFNIREDTEDGKEEEGEVCYNPLYNP